MERKDIVSSLLLTDISQLKTLVVPTVEKGKRKQVMRRFLYQAILYDIASKNDNFLSDFLHIDTYRFD